MDPSTPLVTGRSWSLGTSAELAGGVRPLVGRAPVGRAEATGTVLVDPRLSGLPVTGVSLLLWQSIEFDADAVLGLEAAPAGIKTDAGVSLAAFCWLIAARARATADDLLIALWRRSGPFKLRTKVTYQTPDGRPVLPSLVPAGPERTGRH